MRGRTPQEMDVVRAGDAEHVALARAAQRHFDRAHPVDGVRSHPGEGRARRASRARPCRARDARLGGEPDRVGDVGRRAPRGIVGPALGQVERAVDEGVPVPRHVGREDADLAVGDPAGGTGVLPRDAAGGLALLEEAGLVDHQHGVRAGQRLQRVVAHHVAQAIRLPAAPAEGRLLPPRPGVARRLGAHPARLPPFGSEEAVEERRGRARHPLLQEQRPHPRLGLPQRRRPQFQRRLEGCTRHRAHSPPNGRRAAHGPDRNCNAIDPA